MNRQNLPQGAELNSDGVHYRVWAPVCQRVDLEIQSEARPGERHLPLRRFDEGWFEALDEAGRAGDLYKFRLDGGSSYPDPASRWQPLGVHGPSMVVDPWSYQWRDQAWRRGEFRELVIYELHLGTFTHE